MVERKELKVRDITDAVNEITGLVKDNCLVWFEFTNSLWEENLKVREEFSNENVFA